MKRIITASIISLLTLNLTSCIGQMGLTQLTMGVNLKLVDNRYGRAGIYFLAAPIYGITSLVDLLVINSIEFWTGTNPITKKKPAVADTHIDAWMKVNDDVSPSMTDAPLSMLGAPVQRIEFAPTSESNFKINIEFDDGTVQSVEGIRVDNDRIDIYVNKQLVAYGSPEQLHQYHNLILNDQAPILMAQH